MEVVDNSSLGRIYQAAMQLFAEKELKQFRLVN